MNAAVRRAIAEARAAGVAIRYDRHARAWYAFDEQTTQSKTFTAGGNLTLYGVLSVTAELLELREADPLLGAPSWYDEPDGGAR